jgi:hypothetical protein
MNYTHPQLKSFGPTSPFSCSIYEWSISSSAQYVMDAAQYNWSNYAGLAQEIGFWLRIIPKFPLQQQQLCTCRKERNKYDLTTTAQCF